jgi:hypothetical protein
MTKIRTMIILLVGVLLIIPLGCAGIITGSGNTITEIKNFSGFNEIEAHYGFQLELTRSSTFSVEITADDNVWEYIDVDKDGDRLRIRLKGNRIYNSVTLEAKITMPDLYKIDLSGGSQASITGFSSLQKLSINLSGGSEVVGDIIAADADFDLSGGSHVNLEGTADYLDVNGSGGSQLNLESFPVNNADINLSGGGSAAVNVDGTLDVNLSGGSHVTYVGNPTLGDIGLSGGSEVNKK